MTSSLLESILNLFDPPKGKRPWYGGASSLGALRGVSAETAAWKASPNRHCIWELALHIAYWNYAVRRLLDGTPKGSFPRRPANWPSMPRIVDASSWMDDRAILRSEHNRIANIMRLLDEDRLDEPAPGGGAHSVLDLLFGVVTHDIYHVGQIQILKRLAADAAALGRKR